MKRLLGVVDASLLATPRRLQLHAQLHMLLLLLSLVLKLRKTAAATKPSRLHGTRGQAPT
jgi:hypothetical protein